MRTLPCVFIRGLYRDRYRKSIFWNPDYEFRLRPRLLTEEKIGDLGYGFDGNGLNSWNSFN
jgi:hypothetical protein